MFIKHKLFFYANKCSRLSKFSVKPFLSSRTTVLYLTRTTATVGSPSELIRPNLQNLREWGRPYFMQYLLDNAHLYSVVNIDQINVEDETNIKSLKLLKDFLDDPQETKISDDLLDCLNKEFEICDVDEICKFIMLFANYGNSKNISEPLNLFNEILLRRNLSDEETLKIMWVMRESRFISGQHVQYRFFIKATMKLCFKIHRLSSKQVAQLFFYIPKFHPEFLKKVKFSIQGKLKETIPELNAEEFGIVADGFLRSGQPFTHSELPPVILNKATKEIENMNDLLLCRVCKLLECNLKHVYTENLMDFQEKVVPHISKFKEATLIRLILTGIRLNYIHPSLWESTADILKKNMENLNIFEIERLLYATTIYNIHDEELLSLAVKHFKEKMDIKYHNILINFLYHLVHHRLYPEDLLGLVLSECFISQFDPERFPFDLRYKYSFLNCCVELDKPKCNLYFLNQKQRERLFTVFHIRNFTSENLNKCRTTIKKIMNVLEDLYGKNTVCEANCLPHYENGLVMKFDRNLKAQTLESNFERHFYAKDARNDNGLFSLFIMVLPKNDFSYDGNTLILPSQTQIRQLKDLGYTPVLVKNIEWIIQRKKQNEFDFTKKLIQKHLEDLLQEN